MGGGGASQNHYNRRLEDNGSSFSALCVCTHKEAVIEREREQRLKGEKWEGTPEPRGVGAASAELEKEAEPPALEELHKLTPAPIPTSSQRGCD